MIAIFTRLTKRRALFLIVLVWQDFWANLFFYKFTKYVVKVTSRVGDKKEFKYIYPSKM